MKNNRRFEEFLLRELWRAYKSARKGKRKTIDEHNFELNEVENIIRLRDSIIQRTYTPSRGVTFIVDDPVTREIVAAPFRDRVVHHFLYNVCAEWWDRRFSEDSYSCRKKKGTLYAQKRLMKHIRQVTKNYTEEAFAVKLDISGYFMSLDHQKLYERAVWGLERQFFHDRLPDRKNGILCHHNDRDQLYDTLKFLWRQVIFDLPMKNIKRRSPLEAWRRLPKNKSLFCQPMGKGMVIGNLTSQLLSNIFMDQFDRFVTLELGYKHYGRYVDDFFVVVPMAQKKQLMKDVMVMRDYLRDELSLKLHPLKQYRQPVSRGVPFVGAIVHPGFILPSKRMRRRCRAAAYRLAATGEVPIENFVARLGTMHHLNSKRFLKRVFDSLGWESGWKA